MSSTGQVVPVRVYQTGERVMVTAPLPGLEPEEIAVRIDGRRIVIHGERGPHTDSVFLTTNEWAAGPYHRELDVPEPVDGVTTDATYRNGVLVLSMPKATGALHPGTGAEFRLTTVVSVHGERAGYVGRNAPHTSDQHARENSSRRRAAF